MENKPALVLGQAGRRRVDSVERAIRDHLEQGPPLLERLLRSIFVGWMSQRRIRVGDGFSLNLRTLSVPFITCSLCRPKYTAPNYNYGYPNGITTRSKTATVTAFIDDKWYQSSFKLAICTTDC